MEIVIGLHARFGVPMPDGDIASLRTINTLAGFLMAELAAETAPAE